MAAGHPLAVGAFRPHLTLDDRNRRATERLPLLGRQVGGNDAICEPRETRDRDRWGHEPNLEIARLTDEHDTGKPLLIRRNRLFLYFHPDRVVRPAAAGTVPPAIGRHQLRL